MNIVRTLKEMPRLLVMLTLLGLSAPFLALISVWTGNVINGGADDYAYGAAKSIYELMFVILFTTPIFVASILIMKRRKKSIYYYLAGWIAACLSPLCLSSVTVNTNVYFLELASYIIIGLAIGIFLSKNQSVDLYFSRAPKKNDGSEI